VHRQRIIQAERAKFGGSWALNVRSDEMTCVVEMMELSQLDFQIGVPDGDVGTIDFGGTGRKCSKGIYRIDGDSLILVMNDAGEPRPTTFTDADWFWEGTRDRSASDSSQVATSRP
jgi:uncharacterized protein (TIGR03067 family)